MSGRNWLERDPKDSPGLQRIQEAQQAAAAAKAQTEQQAREAAIAAQEAERKKLERFTKMERAAQPIVSLLAEIRDFANSTRTYPIGDGYPGATFGDNMWNDEKLQVVEKAEVVTDISDRGASITMRYGYRGTEYRTYPQTDDRGPGSVSKLESVAIFYGIHARINGGNGAAEFLSEEEVVVPTEKPTKGHWSGIPISRAWVEGKPGHPEYKTRKPRWVPLSSNREQLKIELANAFHNPVHIGNLSQFELWQERKDREEQRLELELTSQPESQTNTGIAGLVKGFLGLK